MKTSSEDFPGRSLIVFASIAVAIFISTAAHAQRKPIPLEPNATGAAATKAQSVLNRPGSYVLVRNIVNSRAGADALLINTPDVTLDLQGFSIICTKPTTGAGIDATGQINIVIRNGIISGCGGPAVIGGTGVTVSGITASQNGSGITCGVGCLVHDNLIQGNLGSGITFSDATGGYRGNIMQGNSSNTVGTGGQVSGGTSLGQNLCNGVTC
jgi:hypothetical protein